MARRFTPPPPDLVEELRREAERRLDREAFLAYVEAPMSDREREEIDELIDWFTRRYPTPEARADWAQRTWAQLAETLPAGRRGD